MEFILNDKGQAIIRKCENCINWKKITNDKEDQNGYCRANRLLFAYTHANSVYAITKSFYVCDKKHVLYNEDQLRGEFGTVQFQTVQQALDSNNAVPQ